MSQRDDTAGDGRGGVAGTPAAALEVDALSVAYGKVPALRDISLRVDAGTIVTVIGPNGAGKTTLLAAVMGLLASQGSIRCFGEPAAPWSVEQRVARGIVLVPEKRELFAAMSVADNLRLGAFARRRDRSATTTLAEVYARFPRLAERRDQLAGTLSGGERQMLALGRALMARPRLLLLDEPSAGMTHEETRELMDDILVVRERMAGLTIVIIEHEMGVIERITDRCVVLNFGRKIAEGPYRAVAADAQVQEAYLGVA